MRHGQGIASILVVVAGLLVIGVGVRAAAGGALPAASGSPSPSATPTATPVPVLPPSDAGTVRRALRKRTAAVTAWREWNRARSALALRVVPFHRHSARTPARAEPGARWLAAGQAWKHDRGAYRARVAHLVWHMKHPGGTSSGARWMPLARWVGWPRYALSELAYIIQRESSGRECAYNGVIGCSGLLQIWPGHVSQPSRLFDAEYNLRVGLRLWRSQGWGPWAL